MHIFTRITRLFLKYKGLAALSYLSLFAGAALSMAIPKLTGRAIDLALGSSAVHLVVLTAAGIGIAGILRGILNYGQTYLSESLSQRVAYDLRKMFYDRLQKLSYAFHDRSQTGQLMSRATSDVEGVRMFVGFALLRGIYFAVLLAAIAAVLLTLNWRLALISLCVVPLVSFQTTYVSIKLRDIYAKIQQGLGVMGTYIQESLVGAKVVRAFAREDFEIERYSRQAEENYRLEMKTNNIHAFNSPAMSLALLLSMAGILWYGGRLVVTGVITQGQMAEFLLYVIMLNMPVRMLGWLTMLYSRALASGRRVFEVLDEASAVTEHPGARELNGIKGKVRFENVTFSYNSEDETLKDITFEAEPGQIIALVGASGSGKSTVANLLPRFYDVTSGRITIDDTDIRDVTLESLRRNVGIVHQDTFLFSATIRENICYGKPDATLEQIKAAAKVAQLHDFITGLPEGYETWVGERGITLSGGQKQRLAIARTILLNPRIIIMDDVTSSVDMETEYLLRQALNELLAGRTTFIIAQRLRSVQMADLILVLEDGKIVERGKHRELIARDGYYSRLYSLQFQYQDGWSAEETTQDSAGSMPAPLPVKEEKAAPATGRKNAKSRLSDTDDIVFGKTYDLRIVGRMAKYFAYHKKAVIVTIMSTLLYTATIVASPYLVGIAINNYITAGDLTGLNTAILFFLGNAALNFLAYFGQIRAEAAIGVGVLLRLRREIFSHLQRLSISFFDHNEAGRVMSRAQDDAGEIGDYLDNGIFWHIGEIVSLVTIIAVMLGMNLRLGLITFSVTPFVLLFIYFWQNKARHSFILKAARGGENIVGDAARRRHKRIYRDMQVEAHQRIVNQLCVGKRQQLVLGYGEHGPHRIGLARQHGAIHQRRVRQSGDPRARQRTLPHPVYVLLQNIERRPGVQLEALPADELRPLLRLEHVGQLEFLIEAVGRMGLHHHIAARHIDIAGYRRQNIARLQGRGAVGLLLKAVGVEYLAWLDGCVHPCRFADLLRKHPRYRLGFFRSEILHPLSHLIETVAPLLYKGFIIKAFIDNYIKHSKGKSAVRPGANLQVNIGAGGEPVGARVNDDELGAPLHAIDNPMSVKTIMTTGGGILRPDNNVLGHFIFRVLKAFFKELGTIRNGIITVSGEHCAEARRVAGMTGEADLHPVGTAVSIHQKGNRAADIAAGTLAENNRFRTIFFTDFF